jgi:hypothetical protein
MRNLFGYNTCSLIDFGFLLQQRTPKDDSNKVSFDMVDFHIHRQPWMLKR